MVSATQTKQRYVSTGIGGAANFKQAKNMAQKQTASMKARDRNGKAHFATGRGGVGNIVPTAEVAPPLNIPASLTRPRLLIITGRGGAGNVHDAKTGRSMSESSSRTLSSDVKSSIWSSQGSDTYLAGDDGHDSSTELINSTSLGFFGRMRHRLNSSNEFRML